MQVTVPRLVLTYAYVMGTFMLKVTPEASASTFACHQFTYCSPYTVLTGIEAGERS